MAQDQNALVWLDMEMTGLSPENDRILELAMVITNSNLETIAESAVWAVHQSQETLEQDGRVESAHPRQIGPHRQGEDSALSEAEVEAQALAFLQLDC